MFYQTMSEFKYACPVCGQHIKCDSSQAGSQMECPTCFQKITVPQAPSTGEQKFIITGTKVGERPVPTVPQDRVVAAPGKKFPVAAVVILLALACAAGAAAFVFRGKIFKPGDNTATTNEEVSASDGTPAPPPATAPPRRRAAPPPVAPPASDSNWMLNLASATTPSSPAAGRIHGQDFIVERTILQNGTLTLRAGRNGTMAFGLVANFGGATPEDLSGKTINVSANAAKAAVVTLHWKDGSQPMSDTFANGYAMRLEFAAISGNRLPGKIYFCAPDETKSYVAGTFNADIRRPRPPRPPN
jgi:DNA-directed RNA polymerase subunit RPC12/RpoP